MPGGSNTAFYKATGQITVYGTATSSVNRFRYNGGGQVALSGKATILSVRWLFVSSGGIGMSSGTSSGQGYSGSGTVSLAGSGIGKNRFSYLASGGPALAGAAHPSGQFYRWTASGGLSLSGTGTNSSSDLGEQSVTGYGTASLTAFAFGFRQDSLPPASPPTVPAILVPCDCRDIPALLELEQGLGTGAVLSDFLTRNSFVLGKILPLRYHAPNTRWLATFRFSGLAADGASTEVWSGVFEWQCARILGATDTGSPVWKFGVTVSTKGPTRAAETRMLYSFSPSGPCHQGDFLRFGISVNTQTQVAVTDPTLRVYSGTIADGIGLFKGPAWIKDPGIAFAIGLNLSNAGTLRIPYTH